LQAWNTNEEGRPSEAITLADAGLARAREAGSEEARGLLLLPRGYARIANGDAAGIGDVEEATRLLARHSHPETAFAYANLVDLLLHGLGEIPRAEEALTEANVWAQRFGRAFHIGFVAIGQVALDYHAGRWDAALTRATRLAADTNAYWAFWAQGLAGRITLASGDTQTALAAADAMTAYAHQRGDQEVLLEALAFRAQARSAAGDRTAARQAWDEFFAEPQRLRSIRVVASPLAELASTPDAASEHPRLAQAANLLPDASRWKHAILHVTNAQYAEAATLYHEIGSRPLQAAAHLQAATHAADTNRPADAAHHARQALDLYQPLGATLYQQQAEAVLLASTTP
jgi:hypothetical protein